MLEVLVGSLGVACAIAYAVLGGADFGGGVWDLFARGPRARGQRDAIAHAMTPVWEANHVWLIFLVVILFAAFPRAYAEIGRGLFVPLHLALVGITLRGAAFVFRAYGPIAQSARWGAIFGASSVITPLLLGAALGALGEAGLLFWAPLPLAMGALALALCAYLAAIYVANETSGPLREDFRRRALGAGTVTVALSGVLLAVVVRCAPHLAAGLLSARAAPILLAGAIAAGTSGVALVTRRLRLARAAAVVQVALLFAGWAVAQYPYIVYPTVMITNAGAREGTLRFILWTAPLGGGALAAAMMWLFRVFKSRAGSATRSAV
jgi:cytochrome d ubiquinol oxidase subunit II